MRVLFVRGGNRGFDPISTRQGESLKKEGLEVFYFDVVGKGYFGYLSNVFKLRKEIKNTSPDIVHGHYALTGFLTSISFTSKPIVVSLMGSDILSSNIIHLAITRFFSRKIWTGTIVKSRQMKEKLNSTRAVIIPNGVDLNVFSPISKQDSLLHLAWDFKKKHIIFSSDPSRIEKNYELAEKALEQLKLTRRSDSIEMHNLKGLAQEEICFYYNAADVLLMTSLYEGSPNVIKEAMASNCPIVSTNVGDVKEILKNTPGTYIVDKTVESVTTALSKALAFNDRTNGREAIKELDSRQIALKIINLYKVLSE